MQQLLRPLRERVATAQPLAALPLTDAACPLRASGTRGKRSWSNAFLHPDDLRTIRHRTAAAKTAEGPSVPEDKAKLAQAPIRRPPSRGGPLHRSASKAIFSLPPGAAHSLFVKNKKRMGAHPAGQVPLAGASIPVAAGAAHSRPADAYGSSRHSGMDMHRGPPRPRESSALGMVWSRMPASSRARLVT